MGFQQGYTVSEWWQAYVWVTKRRWSHLLWLFKTVARTFWPVVTSYMCITAPTVKYTLGKHKAEELTLGIAWGGKKQRKQNSSNRQACYGQNRDQEDKCFVCYCTKAQYKQVQVGLKSNWWFPTVATWTSLAHIKHCLKFPTPQVGSKMASPDFMTAEETKTTRIQQTCVQRMSTERAFNQCMNSSCKTAVTG